MCFRAHRKIENEGIMSLDLFKRLIDEIEGKIYSIKFTGRGEPLINKKFPEFMEYLSGKNFGEVALITNGQLMNEKVMHSVIDHGLDRVAFSIDGLKDEYEKIRAPIKYEQIIDVVTRLYNLRKSKGKTKPIIRIQAVQDLVDDEKEFLRIWEPISDHIQFLVFKDYAAEARGKEQAGYACPFLWQRMVIHWNGTIPMCINDEYEEGVMGDFSKKSIGQIWHDTRFSGARKVHLKGMRDKIYRNCSKCALHRKGHGKDNILNMASTFFGNAGTNQQKETKSEHSTVSP
jgi:radical SAM protein with 4Fe4S-binding SPASM domain